jgi:hypothetical protein
VDVGAQALKNPWRSLVAGATSARLIVSAGRDRRGQCKRKPEGC